MAAFNPDVGGIPAANIPDNTSASRGAIPNRSFEVLFSGIGDAVTGVSNLVDTSIKENIKEDAKSGFALANEPIGNLPPDLLNNTNALQRLQTAYEQGKVSDVYYYGQLNSQLKSLRAKYPGYEDFVDETMQSVTGVRPANAFRNSIIQALHEEASQRNDAEKSWDTWVKQNEAEIGRLFPDYFANPEKYDRDQVRSKVVQLKAGDSTIAAENARINYLQNQDQLNEAQASESATTALNQTASSFWSGASNTMGFDGNDFMKRIASASTTGFSEQEYTQIVSQLNVSQAALKQRLLQTMTQPLVEGSTNSYASILGFEKANQLVDEAMAQFNTVKEMIVNKDYGMAGYYTRLNDLRNNKDVSIVLNASPDLRTMNALKSISPDLADQWLMESGKQEGILNSVVPEITARIAQGSDDFNGALYRADTTNMSAAEKTSFANSLIDTNLKTITSGQATPEQLSNSVNSIYRLDTNGKDVFNLVNPTEYSTLYQRLFNPTVTQAIAASGDKKALETYYEAARDRLTAIPEFTQAAAAVQDVVDWEKGMNIVFDPNTNRLALQATPPALAEGVQPGSFNAKRQQQIFNDNVKRVNQTVSQLNSVFSTIDPMLDAMGASKEQKTQTAQDILKDLKVDVSHGKQDSLFDWMLKGVQNMSLPDINGNVKGGGPTKPPSGTIMMPQGPVSVDTGEDLSFNFEGVEYSPKENPEIAAAINASGSSPLKVAQAYLGRDERNADDAKALSAFFKKAGGIDLDPATTAWCAAFANAVLGQAGLGGTGKVNARSFLNYGEPVDKPSPGDVVVFARGNSDWQGHVGFVVKVNDDGTIDVLGGNQSDDNSGARGVTANIKTFATTNVLGYRRPQAPTA